MMFNRKAKLDEWTTMALISPHQRERILGHEEAKGSRPWVMFGIVGIGIIALVTGLISLVAANWYDVPAYVKLSSYFMIQLAAGYAFIKQSDRHSFLHDGLLMLFALLFFSGIGLISQIFNLHGANWQPIAFWLILTLPIMLLAKKRLAPHIWTALALLAGWLWSYEDNTVYSSGTRFCLFMTFPLILTSLGFCAGLFKRFSSALANAFFSVVL